jgi:hypothetical protein
MAIGTRVTNKFVIASLICVALAVWAQEPEACHIINSVKTNPGFLIGVEARKPYEFRLYRAYLPSAKDASSEYLVEIIQHGHKPIHYTFKNPTDKPVRAAIVKSTRSNLVKDFSGVEYRFLGSGTFHYIDDFAIPFKQP